MTTAVERYHAWSHIVLFLMLFMIGLAVLRFGNPTGLAAGNQTISSDGVGDLKPFLTAVGLLMGMLIATLAALSFNARPTPARQASDVRQPQKSEREMVNELLADIRKNLRR
jgi:multisubunit Na+/H+ antiporter MnhB subunit